jgi:hypothetical protein
MIAHGWAFQIQNSEGKLASVVYNECNNSIGVVAPTVARVIIYSLPNSLSCLVPLTVVLFSIISIIIFTHTCSFYVNFSLNESDIPLIVKIVNILNLLVRK